MEYSSLKKIRFSTMQLLAMGFIATIFLGGILLTLPISNTQPIRFIDALFTATSAVCVTGLVTVVPAVQFTVFGKVILLILIQNPLPAHEPHQIVASRSRGIGECRRNHPCHVYGPLRPHASFYGFLFGSYHHKDSYYGL